VSSLGARRGTGSGRGRTGRHPFADVDLLLWGIPLALTTLAGILIASTQRQADYADWYQHWITAAVGIGLALVVARLRLERVQALQWPVYAITILSLVAVRFVGTSALGAQRWISIAGFHVQPSEFAKLAAILLLAGVLSRFPVERPVDLVRPIGLIFLPWALVFIQPDLGTSLVFGAVLLVMLFWAGLPLPWLVLLLSPLVAAIVAGVAPLLLILWIPLMGWLAWTSLPWKRTAVAVVLAVQGLFAVITPYLWMHGLRTTSGTGWCSSSTPRRTRSAGDTTCCRARWVSARAVSWARASCMATSPCCASSRSSTPTSSSVPWGRKPALLAPPWWCWPMPCSAGVFSRSPPGPAPMWRPCSWWASLPC